jgi:putative transposase
VRVGARRVLRDTEAARGTGIINVPELSRLCGFAQIAQLQQAERQWVAEGLRQTPARDDRWSEGLAVVSSGFVAKIKKELGARTMRRQAGQTDGTFTLREQEEAYSDVFSTENDALSLDNRRF